MQDLAAQLASNKIPRPFNSAAADGKLSDWTETIVPRHDGYPELMDRAGVTELLRGVFGNSPFPVRQLVQGAAVPRALC